MLDKLQAIKEHWEEISQQLSDPEVVANVDRYTKLSKEYKDLKVIVDAYEEYKNVLSNVDFNKELLQNEKDEEMREMAKMELSELENKQASLEEEIKQLLIPKDPEDEKNSIVEIRAGTGGDEAGIFAGDLYRMYTKFAEKAGWKVETVSMNESSSGGYKEVSFKLTGDDVYGTMKYESGVHRVQRVPQTESQGRVHTSAATVAVLPEAEEVDLKIDEKDIRRDTYRSSGAGGQHVNKTESAVRLTHIPSGIVVECQDGRSQLRNHEIAMEMLRTRLYDKMVQEKQEARARERKSLVSTGDRSAKIRTYNFPQGRVTDHRINLTLYNLDAVMNGDIEEILQSLRVAENAEKMKEAE